jgi:hypothetical protein
LGAGAGDAGDVGAFGGGHGGHGLALKAVWGLRVDEEVETIGLDLSEHGEEGYHGA